MNLIDTAESVARKAHEGQFRRDGETPYITHPERVVARLRAQGITDSFTLALAWLHDVLEDTELTWDKLYADGAPDELVRQLRILTRDSNEDYEAYLSRILDTPDARIVKIADILDNLSDNPTEKQILKYCKALLYLHGQ